MDHAPSNPKGWTIPALIIVIVGIALSEVLFRTMIFPGWKAVSQATFVRHPIYGTFQKPNLVARRLNPPNYDVINRTNSLGFRDREERFEDDLSGIWAAGASNSYGGFVEDDEAFAARLQTMGYKVANFSSEGHNLGHQVKVVRHMLSQGYKPRAILFEMTLNNALGAHANAISQLDKPFQNPQKTNATKEDGTAQKQLIEKLGKLREALRISMIGIKGRLINNSAIYCWLKVGINGIPVLRQWSLKVGLREDVALKDSAPPAILRNQSETPKDYLIDSTVKFAVALKRWIDDNVGVPFAIVLIPSPHHLDKQRFAKYVNYLGFKEGELDASRPYKILLKGLADNGIPVLDMAPALLASDKDLSFPDDGHMNATAHGIVAREIAVWLPKELGLESDL